MRTSFKNHCLQCVFNLNTSCLRPFFPVVPPARTLYKTEFLGGIFFIYFFATYLNWFEKVAVSHEHLVPVDWMIQSPVSEGIRGLDHSVYWCLLHENGPFYLNKNWNSMPSFFSQSFINYIPQLDLRSLYIKQSICMLKLQNWKDSLLVQTQTLQQCAAPWRRKYTEEDIIKMLEFLVDNIFVVFAGKVFQ